MIRRELIQHAYGIGGEREENEEGILLFFYISKDGHGNGIDMMDKTNVTWNRMGENVKRKKVDSW